MVILKNNLIYINFIMRNVIKKGSGCYLNIFTEKLKEVLFAVLPITVIVLMLNFTIVPIDTPLVIRFIIGAVLIVVGLAIFLIGVDLGITPFGNLIGTTIAKTNKLLVIIIAGIILGFFISIAEPGLLILASQVAFVTSGNISSISILIVVSVGMAILLAVGFLRIVYNIPLNRILTVLYGVTFVLALFTSSEFLAISFDASGATTGVLAVPFILALSIGVSKLKKDSKASEKDSFGLVSITSVGAIISVMILNMLSGTNEFSASLESNIEQSNSIIGSFIKVLPSALNDTLIAIVPLVLIYLILQKISFKLNKKAFIKILKGFVYAFIGLLIFLVGVNAGFMDVGTMVGYKVASLDSKIYVVVIGFVLGLVTVLAEPAVYVLTHQVEEVTSGYVKKVAVLIPLAVGVGLAVALSMVRIIIPEVRLWHYILPGYIISILMSYFVPKLFVGIAFDAGGVATGPMTATFILAFTQGAADAIEGADLLIDGFGMIAMVAMIPIITLQILGFIFKLRSRKGGIEQNAN